MSRRAHSVAIVVALVGAVGLTTAASAVTAPPRYAGPHGSGTACTKAAPCDIVTAINDAPGGAAVVIEPGTYGSATAPITDELSDANGALAISGATGSPSPVIYASAATNAIDLEHGSSLGHIDLVTAAADTGVLIIGGRADDIIVRSSATMFGACSILGTITDSVCATTAANAYAVFVESTDDTTTTLRGVTAEATGAGGVGLLDAAASSAVVTVDATNSIIHGTTTDVIADTEFNARATVTLSHSDYVTTQASANATGPAAVNGDNSDIKAAPRFVNPTAGDFRERAGSPTINRGVADPTGTDVAGNPRTLGSAPDIGAYEFLPKPAVSHLKTRKVTRHIAHLSVRVNPQGLHTTIYLIAALHGKVRDTSYPVSAGKGRKPITAHLTLRGLHAHTRYVVHALATNQAGHGASAKRHVKTARR
jgi:hypothetical protein